MEMTTIDSELEAHEHKGAPGRIDGGDEVVVPAPGPVTIYTQGNEDDAPVETYMCVGWNAAGSPLVVGADGGLRLLTAGDIVRDVTWGFTS